MENITIKMNKKTKPITPEQELGMAVVKLAAEDYIKGKISSLTGKRLRNEDKKNYEDAVLFFRNEEHFSIFSNLNPKVLIHKLDKYTIELVNEKISKKRSKKVA